MREPRLLRLLLLAVLLAATAAQAQQPGATAPSAAESVRAALSLPLQKATLDNGLRVVMHVDRRAPTVAVCATYAVGLIHERPGELGFTHLIEQLMLRPDRYVALLRARGGDALSRTSLDRTTFCSVAPSGELHFLIWTEGQRLLSAPLTREGLESSRRRATLARRGRVLEAGRAAGRYRLRALALQGYRQYEPDPGAAVEAISARKLAKLRSFFAQYYRPDRAVISIAGDFDTDLAMRLLRSELGQLRGARRPKDFVLPRPGRQTSERFLAFEDPSSTTPVLYFGWVIPVHRTPPHRALALTGALLGGGDGALLQRELVTRRRLAQQVRAWTGEGRGAHLLGLEVVLTRRATVKQVERAVVQQLRRLRYAGPTQPQLDAARSFLMSRLLRRLQTNLQRARMLGRYELEAGDARLLGQEFDEYHSITPAQVRQAVAKYLTDHQRSLVATYPRGWHDPASGQGMQRFHIVHAGENLTNIAKRYSVTVAQLARLNELNPAKPIFPGQKLKLPRNARRPKSPSQPRGSQSKSGSKRPAGAKPAATSSPKRAAETKTKPRSPKARAKPRVHIVQKNQTLLGIARRYRVSLRALLNANGLSADKPIRPGQRLQIPATKR